MTRYTIVKRRILSEETNFSEDELGELVLLPGMRIYSVSMRSSEHQAEGCAGQCLNCNLPCVDCHETVFPQFIQHGDAVKFYDFSGKESYGTLWKFRLKNADLFFLHHDSARTLPEMRQGPQVTRVGL